MSQEEKYANQNYNNQALQNAIQSGQESVDSNGANDSLMTHMQVMDSYREGTIDQSVDDET